MASSALLVMTAPPNRRVGRPAKLELHRYDSATMLRRCKSQIKIGLKTLRIVANARFGTAVQVFAPLWFVDIFNLEAGSGDRFARLFSNKRS
jgi:hypothetical protein